MSAMDKDAQISRFWDKFRAKTIAYGVRRGMYADMSGMLNCISNSKIHGLLCLRRGRLDNAGTQCNL